MAFPKEVEGIESVIPGSVRGRSKQDVFTVSIRDNGQINFSQGFDRIIGGDYQFSFSVTTFPFPVQRSLRIKDSGGIEPIWPKFILERSQDLEETYHDAGQFYWGTSKSFLDDSNLFRVSIIIFAFFCKNRTQI